MNFSEVVVLTLELVIVPCDATHADLLTDIRAGTSQCAFDQHSDGFVNQSSLSSTHHRLP